MSAHLPVAARATRAAVLAALAVCLGGRPTGAEGAGPPTAVVVWGGDVILGRGVAAGLARPGRPDPLAPLRATFAAADLTVVNLEGPLTNARRIAAGFDLTGAPRDAWVLADAGIDAAGVANNHATDNGRAGLEETLTALRRAGVVPIGGGRAPEAEAPARFVRGGLRLALLAFEDLGASYPATATGVGVARYDEARAAAAVSAARAASDVVLVQVHWGQEYDPSPSPRQRAVARALVDAGADAVMGHHPHVVQPIEWLARPGRRPALVAYSLGNLLFDALDPATQRGLLVETRLTAEGVIGLRTQPVHTSWAGAVPLGPMRRAPRRVGPRQSRPGVPLSGRL